MKKAIIILAVLLALLLIVAGILLFTDVLSSPAGEPTEASTEAPTESVLPTEATQQVTEPATTEEAATEPQIEVVPDEQVSVLNGFRVATYFVDGVRMIERNDFVNALELYFENVSLKLYGIDSLEETDNSILINGKQIEGVVAPAVAFDGGPADDGSGQPTDVRVLYLPFDELIAAMGCPLYVDEDTGVHYYTPSARRFEIPQNVNVPVLMYHAVSDEIWGYDELFVSPSDMETQLAYIVDNGYDAIWFEDLSHIEDYDKPVILTFDDGYMDNYTNLFPLLQKYGVKATIFVIGSAPNNQEHSATEQQIREMSTSGLVSIQSHSYTHPDMDGLNYDETQYEMAQSKKIITRIAGKEPIVLCYPTGRYNDYTLELGPEYYMFGIKMNGGLYNTSANPFLVNRYYVSRYTDIYTFAAYLSAAGT